MSIRESNDAWPWRRGVVYTVRPEMLAPLERGREYRILIGVRRMAPIGEPFTAYGELYRRAATLTDARVAAMIGPEPPARWTAWHGWRAMEFGERQFIFVFIATFIAPGAAQAGERAPTDEELASPGGASRELLMRQSRQRVDEFYNDFDHRSAGESAEDEDSIFSYGEYVSSIEAIDFEPFAQRAEAMARYHYGSELRVVRHDCFCATHPNVAVVHVLFREPA